MAIECPICLEEILEIYMLPCKHKFCKECFWRYINTCYRDNKTHVNCPLCRYIVVDIDINYVDTPPHTTDKCILIFAIMLFIVIPYGFYELYSELNL
jgi:hypothetical protein